MIFEITLSWPQTRRLAICPLLDKLNGESKDLHLSQHHCHGCHPEVVKNFQTAVIDPVGSGPQAYGQVIVRENEAMARAAKVANLKAE